MSDTLVAPDPCRHWSILREVPEHCLHPYQHADSALLYCGCLPCFGNSHALTEVHLALMVAPLGMNFFTIDMLAMVSREARS